MYELIRGDCLEVLPTLTGIDALVTDPPYGVALKNHDIGGTGKNRHYHIPGDDTADATLQVLLWAELHALPTIVFASPWKPWPGKWRNLIVWDKGGAVGGGGDPATCLKRSWELIQVARNKAMNGKRAESVWRFVTTPSISQQHIAAKPVKLMQSLILRFTLPNDTILDPFMGSGSTGVACIKMGRNFIGIETDPTYFAIAQKRISEAAAQPFLLEVS
jgi:DNA modification methylase